MRQLNDSFGEPIEEGDWILSAATTGYGRPTIGYARYRKATLGVEVKHGYSERKVKESGSVVVVLQHADGRMPKRVFLPADNPLGVSVSPELPGMWDVSDLIGGETDV
jgi:hypothetical protein